MLGAFDGAEEELPTDALWEAIIRLSEDELTNTLWLADEHESIPCLNSDEADAEIDVATQPDTDEEGVRAPHGDQIEANI